MDRQVRLTEIVIAQRNESATKLAKLELFLDEARAEIKQRDATIAELEAKLARKRKAKSKK